MHRGRAQEYGAKPTIVNTSTGHPDVRTPLHSRPDQRVAVQSTSDIDTCCVPADRSATGTGGENYRTCRIEDVFGELDRFTSESMDRPLRGIVPSARLAKEECEAL